MVTLCMFVCLHLNNSKHLASWFVCKYPVNGLLVKQIPICFAKIGEMLIAHNFHYLSVLQFKELFSFHIFFQFKGNPELYGHTHKGTFSSISFEK